jgi:hypothetical protein
VSHHKHPKIRFFSLLFSPFFILFILLLLPPPPHLVGIFVSLKDEKKIILDQVVKKFYCEIKRFTPSSSCFNHIHHLRLPLNKFDFGFFSLAKYKKKVQKKLFSCGKVLGVKTSA